MISFRLSEDEYKRSELVRQRGCAQCLDLARNALGRLIGKGSNGSHHLDRTVQTMQIRLDAMDLELKRISLALQGRGGTVARSD